MFYDREIAALRRAGRFRSRALSDENLFDFASNDYLGLAHRKKSFNSAYETMYAYDRYAPKASMLVNGYHEIHKSLEERLTELNGFESGIVTGSGFLSNIALIESMVRRGDHLLMDEEFHASGILATAACKGKVTMFAHNSAEDLDRKLKKISAKRIVVAVEGVYSMSGDLLSKDIFEVSDRHGTLLLVDEAHSSGVIGDSLLGVFDYHGILPAANHIKMGTLGKAYGSYGAYILASGEIISYLLNRGKPIIYSTALSLFDTALALANVDYISMKYRKLRKRLDIRREVVKRYRGRDLESMILPIKCKSDRETVLVSEKLKKLGFSVGAIRRPTVAEPILRIIPRLGCTSDSLEELLQNIERIGREVS